MASVGEPLRSDPFMSPRRNFNKPDLSKNLPILTSTAASSPGDPMDTSQPPTVPMGPPSSNTTNGEKSGEPSQQTHTEQHSSDGGSSQAVGAAAAAQQPKVVQTAFIHKLYNMLEDQSIQHLISWSGSNESFVMSPSSEFSKVLAQYFKHTNISSFVRQLNMYGFHKVSDVFHTGSPDSPLWEFKHGAGNFKRGDLVGLREIKRRTSRHALIHRDSFSTAPKMPAPQTPGTPMETMADPAEARLNILEWNNQDLYTRLTRTEEAYTAMTSKCQMLLEGIQRCHHWNHELSSHLLTLVPDPDNPVHRDVYAMRQDISRNMEQLRCIEDSQESLFGGNKQSYFPTGTFGVDPRQSISPRQRPYDESRRPSLQGTSLQGSVKALGIRPAMSSFMQASPRRHGSIGGTASGAYSPTPARPAFQAPAPPTQPHQQHPLSNMTSPSANLSRRHTSADIRLQGWDGGQPPNQFNHAASPYASGQSSSAWPSSPRASGNSADQHIRDVLAQYDLPRASLGSRQTSPGPHDTTATAASASAAPSFASSFGGSYANNNNDAGWQLPGPKYPFRGLETPGPPTRRSSMASNVHSLLNPADTAEREGEDEGPDERKRKRV